MMVVIYSRSQHRLLLSGKRGHFHKKMGDSGRVVQAATKSCC